MPPHFQKWVAQVGFSSAVEIRRTCETIEHQGSELQKRILAIESLPVTMTGAMRKHVRHSRF